MLPPDIQENLNRFFDTEQDEDIILGIQLAQSVGIDLQKYLDYSIYSIKENETFFFPQEPTPPEIDLIKAIRVVRQLKHIEISLEEFLQIDFSYFSKDLTICIDSFESFHKIPVNCVKLSSSNSIKEVRLRKCYLGKIPDFIFEIKSLIKLDVSHNSIKEIPLNITKLVSLKELALQFNAIEQLPSDLMQLTNLETLWIACNNFTQLPSVLTKMPNLRELYFFDMPIDPNQIDQFTLQMPNCKFYFR